MTPSLSDLYEKLMAGKQDKSSYSFDSAGRRQYVEIMKQAGYSEQKEFEMADVSTGYWCNTCEYFTKKFSSPTEFFCDYWKFPDRTYGCCRSWEKKQ